MMRCRKTLILSQKECQQMNYDKHKQKYHFLCFLMTKKEVNSLSEDSTSFVNIYLSIINNNIMEETIFFFTKNRFITYYLLVLILNMMIPHISCVNSNNSTFILLHSDFQTPVMNQTSKGYQQYQSPMGAWECSTTCDLVSLPFYCNISKMTSCFQNNNQSINIQTSCQAGVVSSIYQKLTGVIFANYTLSYAWMLPQPLIVARSKTLVVYMDQIQVHSLVITNMNKTQVFITEQVNVTLSEGDHFIEFVLQGGDCSTLFLDNMQLISVPQINNSTENSTLTNQNQSISNQSTITQNNSTSNNNTNQISNLTESLSPMAQAAKTAVNTAFNNQLTQFINSLPASRIALSFLMKFYINIDRFDFYKYHRRNLTYYSSQFLEAIYALKEAQGNLLKDMLQSSESIIGSLFEKIKTKLTQFMGLKSAYSNSYILDKNQLGSGFIENNIDFFCYQLPIIFLMIIMFRFAFTVTFSCRISLNFRKYCFLPIILVIIFQGNLEQFAYYILAELTYLFSNTFSHKISNTIILTFGFIIIFYCFGFFFSIRIYYRKQYRYFVDQLNAQFSSITAVMIDCGIVPLLSAAIQYHCLEYFLLETVLLILMELSWLFARLYFLCNNIYAIPFRVGINLIGNILRIVFLISLYLFNQTNDSELYQPIHFYFIFSYIGIWILQTLLTVYLAIKQLSMLIRKQKISPTKKQNYHDSIDNNSNLNLKKIKQNDKNRQNLISNQLTIQLAESNRKQVHRKIRISKYICRKDDIIMRRPIFTQQVNGIQFKRIVQHK